MTVKDAARRLEVSEDTVYQLCARGKLAHRRIGCGRGTIRITDAQLAAYVTAAEQGPPPALPPARSRREPIPDILAQLAARKGVRR